MMCQVWATNMKDKTKFKALSKRWKKKFSVLKIFWLQFHLYGLTCALIINNPLIKEKIKLFIKNLWVCTMQFCKTVINSCPSKPVKIKNFAWTRTEFIHTLWMFLSPYLHAFWSIHTKFFWIATTTRPIWFVSNQLTVKRGK